VRRAASGTQRPLAAADPHVIAIASDDAVEVQGLPVFALDDIDGIAAFIETRLRHLRPPSRPHTSQAKRAGRGAPGALHRRRR
jgi:hypothetical protein